MDFRALDADKVGWIVFVFGAHFRKKIQLSIIQPCQDGVNHERKTPPRDRIAGRVHMKLTEKLLNFFGKNRFKHLTHLTKTRHTQSGHDTVRSEERRVGKECRSRWS